MNAQQQPVDRAESGPMGPREEQHPHGGDWLRDIVFGLNDGLVTTLVFLMAVSELAPQRLLLIVLGEVSAGGISMALGGYLSARTAQQVLDQRIATERFEIQHEPDEERAELRAIYRRKGFRGALLDRIIAYLTANEERWHRALITDELGLVEETRDNPWRQAALIGLAFVIGGLIPTVPVLLGLPGVRWWAYGLTAATALTLGAIKARYTGKNPIGSGLEFLVVVTVGTLGGMGMGLLLHAG
jgi:VIT1/CCC1 family predicted Fe2+/Mn2+ transporter